MWKTCGKLVWKCGLIVEKSMVFVEKSGAGNAVFKNAIFLRGVYVTFAQVMGLFGSLFVFVWTWCLVCGKVEKYGFDCGKLCG